MNWWNKLNTLYAPLVPHTKCFCLYVPATHTQTQTINGFNVATKIASLGCLTLSVWFIQLGLQSQKHLILFNSSQFWWTKYLEVQVVNLTSCLRLWEFDLICYIVKHYILFNCFLLFQRWCLKSEVVLTFFVPGHCDWWGQINCYPSIFKLIIMHKY